MGLPIYQIQMYQKAPLILNHTNITQIGPCNCKMLKIFDKNQGDAPKGLQITVTSHYFQ